MARVILIYGQAAAGKTFALRNLDPKTTVIIDADTKNALPWRGWKTAWGKAKKNYYPIDDIPTLTDWIAKFGDENSTRKDVKTIVIDGLNTAMSFGKCFNVDRTYQGWANLGQSIINIIRYAKKARDDLNIILTAHVELADPNVPNSKDKLKTPGKMASDVNIESLLLYVLYAKHVDGEYFFETQDNNSTARSPEGCFPLQIPNDIKAVIDAIDAYEKGEN